MGKPARKASGDAKALLSGVVARWDDERGFGMIETGPERVFVHATDFRRGQRRPESGDKVRFTIERDVGGKPRARNVEFGKTAPVRKSAPAPIGGGGGGRDSGWSAMIVLAAAPCLAGASLTGIPWVTPLWFAGVSLFTYRLYRTDKRMAVTGGWRIPERALHLAELCGGWPGAFLARRALRHKSKKISFLVVSAAIVLLYQVAAADVLLDHRLSRATTAAVREWIPDVTVHHDDSGG